MIGVYFIIYHEQLSDTLELISMRKLRMGPLGSLRLGWSLERPSDWKPPTSYLREGEGELETGLYKNSCSCLGVPCMAILIFQHFFLFWNTHSGRCVQPCYEQPNGETHTMRNRGFLPTLSKEISFANCYTSKVGSIFSSSSQVFIQLYSSLHERG